MKVIHNSEEAIVIDLVTEDELWQRLYDGQIQYGDRVPGKLVVKEKESTLFVYVPKLIPDGKTFREHLKKERKTIDYQDFLIMNDAMREVFRYKTELLP